MNKLSRLAEIARWPEPIRSGALRRYFDGHFPAYSEWRNRRLLGRLAKLPSQPSRDPRAPVYIGSVNHWLAGFGHAFSEWNTGLLIARRLGLEFAHSPFVPAFEDILGFAPGFADLSQLLADKIVAVHRLPVYEWKNRETIHEEIERAISRVRINGPTLFLLGDGQSSFVQHETTSLLRRLFWSQPWPASRERYREPGRINVGVHVRRRNAKDLKNASVSNSASAAYRARYLNSEFFLSIMKSVQASGGPDTIFHIYSQGLTADFDDFLQLPNTRLHLEADEVTTFLNLADSDVLVTSPSSFSFHAGMLCSGIKLAKYPWWHLIPDDSEWIRVGDGIPPDGRELQEKLHSLRPPAF